MEINRKVFGQLNSSFCKEDVPFFILNLTNLMQNVSKPPENTGLGHWKAVESACWE